jgi:methyl-accepting chemotaxis protein
MNNTVTKRRQIFIKKDFQGRFILGAFALILLAGLCSALLIYWMTGGDLQAQSQSAHANIVNAAERLGVSILIGNLVAILVAGGIAVSTVLYASHKIAGPLYRFETLCQEVGDGKLDTVTHLREHDQLQDLALSFSNMVAKLRSRRDHRTRLIAELNRQIGLYALNNGDALSETQHHAVATMAALVTDLEKLEK